MIWLRGQAKFEAPVFYILTPHWSSCVFLFLPFCWSLIPPTSSWIRAHTGCSVVIARDCIEPVCSLWPLCAGYVWWFILMSFLWFLVRSPGKNYSYAIKFTPGSAGFNMVRKYKFLGLYKVETYLGWFFSLGFWFTPLFREDGVCVAFNKLWKPLFLLPGQGY